MFIPIGNAMLYAAAFGPTAAPAILGIGGWIGSRELWHEAARQAVRHYLVQRPQTQDGSGGFGERSGSP